MLRHTFTTSIQRTKEFIQTPLILRLPWERKKNSNNWRELAGTSTHTFLTTFSGAQPDSKKKKILFSLVTLLASSALQVYLLGTLLVFRFTGCSTHSSTFAQHILSPAVDFFFFFWTCTIPNLRSQCCLSAKIIQIPPKIPKYAQTTEMQSKKPWQLIILISN